MIRQWPNTGCGSSNGHFYFKIYPSSEPGRQGMNAVGLFGMMLNIPTHELNYRGKKLIYISDEAKHLSYVKDRLLKDYGIHVGYSGGGSWDLLYSNERQNLYKFIRDWWPDRETITITIRD